VDNQLFGPKTGIREANARQIVTRLVRMSGIISEIAELFRAEKKPHSLYHREIFSSRP